jgi:hypothetical protein
VARGSSPLALWLGAFLFARVWLHMPFMLPARAAQHHSFDWRAAVNQLGFPSEVTPQEVAREQSLGGAINLCAKAAGLTPKEVQDGLKADRAQFSRWTDDKEGILWSKLSALMDLCGNDAPLFWMLQARGYDLSSLRRMESELERRLRLAEEALAKEKTERAIERQLLRDLRVPA